MNYNDLVKAGLIRETFFDRLYAGKLESWGEISIICAYFFFLGCVLGAIMALMA